MYVVYFDFAPSVWYSTEYQTMFVSKDKVNTSLIQPKYCKAGDSVWMIPGTWEYD